MAIHRIIFKPSDKQAEVPSGALVVEALREAGLDVAQPCGGQGRCGRCAVVVEAGEVRRRSTIRLSAADVQAGYALACQTVIEGDAAIFVPEQQAIERRLTTDKTARKIAVPFPYDCARDQNVRAFSVSMDPPSLTDAVDDYARLERALAPHGIRNLDLPLPVLQQLGDRLRQGDWRVTAVVETDNWRRPDGPPRLIDIVPATVGADPRVGPGADPRVGPGADPRVGPGADPRVGPGADPRVGPGADPRVGPGADPRVGPGADPRVGPGVDTWVRPYGVYGVAIDIGTTTVSVLLVDLQTGEAIDSAAEYNGQIARGEDVISRIVYAGQDGGLSELAGLVTGTINEVIGRLAQRNHVNPRDIYKASVAGNSTMMHLFLKLPPASIRLAPYIPTVNQPPPLMAGQLGLDLHPLAAVDCLPGVASYVGADITAGVLSSGMAEADGLTLFIDVGTNGEMVLGTKDWAVTCACSAGPAFEGAGVVSGMRATRGAIEEVWINAQTFEPTYRVIGETRPRGLCGSGLISLVAELYITGVVDKGGNFAVGADLVSARISRLRRGEHGPEYVVAWGSESATGRDIVLTKVDVDNLMRAKAAIYAGFTVLAQSVGVDLGDVERVLIGGAFGKYINVEKAVQIGLLPDMPWDRFHFLGNTSVMGAYMALLSRQARAQIKAIAEKMTYVELSADNTFYDAFTSALFLPHTDLSRFPSVAALWQNGREHA